MRPFIRIHSCNRFHKTVFLNAAAAKFFKDAVTPLLKMKSIRKGT